MDQPAAPEARNSSLNYQTGCLIVVDTFRVAKVVSVEKFEVVIAGSNHSLQMILSNNLFFLKNGFERMNVQGRRMTPSYFCLPLVLCDNQLKVILVVAADAVFAIEANGKSVTTDAGIAVRKDTATTVGTRLP
jgi:hypothetical protein